MNVSQAAIEAIIIVCQLIMLETEQMQRRRVEIPDGGRIELGPATKLISGAIAGAPFDAGPPSSSR